MLGLSALGFSHGFERLHYVRRGGGGLPRRRGGIGVGGWVGV